ncbi:MAG: hypothetical protein K0S57_2987 [Ramlibacter sp.]|jgi:hypothetical protein|nr:hypothetical protein [Ramlibacter sp.]
MSAFEHSFLQALLHDPTPTDDALAHALAAQPAFAVYRNTVMKGCIDALEANFPAVVRLVGREWFRAAAAAYVADRLPRDGCLLSYGDDGFGPFLASLPTTTGLPWLPAVATLDTLWRAAHAAADAPVLDAAALAGDAPRDLAARVLCPHPAARWAWFDAAPVASIWSRNRDDHDAEADYAWQGEGLLLTRVEGAVAWQVLPRAGCALLDACAARLPLGEAAEQALQQQPGADLAAVLRQLLLAGAFSRPEVRSLCLEHA